MDKEALTIIIISILPTLIGFIIGYYYNKEIVKKKTYKGIGTINAKMRDTHVRETNIVVKGVYPEDIAIGDKVKVTFKKL